MTEEVIGKCSIQKMFLEISRHSQENTCARVSFLINLQFAGCHLIEKDTLAQVFSCEFREISKDTFFHRTRPVAASETTTVKILCILKKIQSSRL